MRVQTATIVYRIGAAARSQDCWVQLEAKVEEAKRICKQDTDMASQSKSDSQYYDDDGSTVRCVSHNASVKAGCCR